MKRQMIALALLTATLGTVGCGVNEDLYNATVRDRDAEKQKLAATQTALDAEKAQRKKEIDARDARIWCSPTSSPRWGRTSRASRPSAEA